MAGLHLTRMIEADPVVQDGDRDAAVAAREEHVHLTGCSDVLPGHW